MKKQWMLAYPRHGNWFHVKNLIQLGELIEYAESHLRTHDVMVKGFFDKNTLLWFLNSEQKIRTFCWCVKDCLGKTKVRMEVREK